MNKRKALVMAVAVVALIAVSLTAFVACGDKNGNGAGMRFSADTTLSDIWDMIDNGEITGYTMKYSDDSSDIIYYVTPQYWFYEYTGRDDNPYNVVCGIILENDVAYWIYNDYNGLYRVSYCGAGDAGYEYILEMWDSTVHHMGKYDEEVQNFDIKVDGTTISWTRHEIYDDWYEEWDQTVYISLYNVNATTFELPDEIKNYKDIAVREDDME